MDTWSEAARQLGRNSQKKIECDLQRRRLFIASFKKIIRRLGLDKSHDVLDVGCGAGEMANAISSSVKSYTGIDVSEDMLCVARSNSAFGNSVFELRDVVEYHEVAKYHAVISLTCIDQIHNKPAAIKNLMRAARSDHAWPVYIEVRNRKHLLSYGIATLRPALRLLGINKDYAAEGFRDLSFEEWISVFEECGVDWKQGGPTLRPVFFGKGVELAKNILAGIISRICPFRLRYMLAFHLRPHQ